MGESDTAQSVDAGSMAKSTETSTWKKKMKQPSNRCPVENFPCELELCQIINHTKSLRSDLVVNEY